jgi:hypothetical protein
MEVKNGPRIFKNRLEAGGAGANIAFQPVKPV